MSKKKLEHIAYLDEAVKSVILKVSIKTLCGEDIQLTREEMESTEYLKTCSQCMAEVAKAAIAHRDVIRLIPKQGWLDLVERAWKLQYDQLSRLQRPQTAVSFNWLNTSTTATTSNMNSYYGSYMW